MSLPDLHNIVNRAAAALHDKEKFSVEALALRAERAAQACPTDPTLVAMSNFLSKRADSQAFISRAELKDVYRRLYSQNNQFGTIFASELGITETSKVVRGTRDPNEGVSLTSDIYEKMGNPLLSKAFEAAMDGKADLNHYTPATAKMAAQTCLQELSKYAMPRKIDVIAGQADVLICQATYETPKGQTGVIVPVEIREGKALLPTVFLSQYGFLDLAQTALEDHIVATAGKRFSVDVPRLLQVVSSAKGNQPKRGLSEMEMIIARASVAKAEAKGEAILQHTNGILNQVVDAKPIDVEASHRLPEADTFAAKLASPKGAAEFIFGRDVVTNARTMVRQAMANFGFSHSNIALNSYDDKSMYFAVSVDNRTAFKVPVKVANHAPQLPGIIVIAGSLYPFSKAGISNALKEEANDGRMMAAASPVYDLKSGDLIEEVRQAMTLGDHARAEDALNVLQNSGDDAGYKQAFATYLEGLNPNSKVATASAECDHSGCKAQRKVAYSKHVICGHTNLPIHKVYQDKNGDCQPLYRKNIAEATTGSFMTAKILGF